jgi:hypothetical protein
MAANESNAVITRPNVLNARSKKASRRLRPSERIMPAARLLAATAADVDSL